MESFGWMWAVCWLPHLLSLMTSFSPFRRVSVLMSKMFNTIPTPLLAILAALSGWSPFRGTISMGTAWHSPSNRPCEPAWVMNARAPGWATTQNMQKYQMLWDVTHQRASHFRMCCCRHTPSRSFCGTHFIIFTFSGTLSGTFPVYLHMTCHSFIVD